MVEAVAVEGGDVLLAGFDSSSSSREERSSCFECARCSSDLANCVLDFERL
jgi:hypothetical protein